MRTYYIFLILIFPIVIFAQGESENPCPGCDLPLSGFAIGGFFGVGTFSVDADSPQVTEQMLLDAMPSWSYRAGGGFYFYPIGKLRLGLIGGYNWTGVSENYASIKSNAMWGVFMPEIIRTTGVVRLTAGLGFGGGFATLKVKEMTWNTGELEQSAEEQVPMFALYPKAGFEIPFGENVMVSLDLSYLWFIGEDRTLSWEGDDHFSPGGYEGLMPRELRFSPVEFGGPAVSMSLYFGKVSEIVPPDEK